MKVLVTGATGLVGKNVCKHLLKQGHELVVLSRQNKASFAKVFSFPCTHYQWQQSHLEPPPIHAFDGVGAVIHLAGESIAGGRWTKKRKQAIYESRVHSSRSIADVILQSKQPPAVVISASAVGYYGNTRDVIIDEESAKDGNFLGMVCQDWETAWDKLNTTSTRVVKLRIGVILSIFSGFLTKLQPIFDLNLGGKIGNGKQWMSWIHIQDLIRLIDFSLHRDEVRGAVNAVAPEPCTNGEFTKAFAKALKKWAFFPVPPPILKFAMGEMSILALGSQRVIPKKALGYGFQFNFPTINTALNNLYAWRKSSNDQLLEVEQWVGKDVQEVFPFFSDAKNLEQITPPWLQFKVLGKDTDEIQNNTRIDYRLKVRGLPLKWQSQITSWKDGEHFSDIQRHGPYAKWEHDHGFEPLAQGTLLSDHVVYQVPGKFFGQAILGCLVSKDVKKIFNYRNDYVRKHFKA